MTEFRKPMPCLSSLVSPLGAKDIDSLTRICCAHASRLSSSYIVWPTAASVGHRVLMGSAQSGAPGVEPAGVSLSRLRSTQVPLLLRRVRFRVSALICRLRSVIAAY
jgi:hypothetical protein